MNRRPRRTAGLAAAALSLLVLTAGCGADGPQPGVAVRVGDEVVSQELVNTAAQGLCDFYLPQLEEADQSLPLLQLRRNAAVLLTLRSGVEQLAADLEVGPGADYERQMTRLQGDVIERPSDLRDAFLETFGAQPLVLALVPRIGAELLSREGETDSDISVATARGLTALLELLSGDGVEFAPGIGLTFQGGEVGDEVQTGEFEQLLNSLFTLDDSSSSIAVSDVATAADSGDQAYAAALPAAQRCG